MIVETIHRSQQVAKKAYTDDGWENMKDWIDGGCYLGYYRKIDGVYKHINPKITFAEARILVKHRNKPRPYAIEKGEKYERQFNKDGGDAWVFRMNSELFEIANKYKLFNEWND